jgi:hypothetical protein
MAHPAVAIVESALRVRKLDRTLTTMLPPVERADPSSLLPTDIPRMDGCLRGGLPRGQLSELTGACSSGRMTLLLHLIAAATRRGEIAAFVDTHDRLDVASAAAAGVDLDRLLWIRGSGCDSQLTTHNSSLTTHLSQLITHHSLLDRALKALNLVLQAGGFAIVAIDLAHVPATGLRQIPFTTWPRLQRAIEGRDTACVLVTPEPLARSAGGLTLSLTGRSMWAGSGRGHRLQGLELRVRVVSPRKRIAGEVTVSAGATA